MIYKTHYNCPLGKITLAAYKESLVGLWLEGQHGFTQSVCEDMAENDALPIFKQTKKWLDSYFNGEKPAVSALALAPAGNAFRQAVWKILCDIPYGQVTTYGEIARRIAKQQGVPRMSAQAVGGAVGHNPIPIIIPCHRVVGSNGNLTGYAGGIPLKIKLLEHEKVDMRRFWVPRKHQRIACTD